MGLSKLFHRLSKKDGEDSAATQPPKRSLLKRGLSFLKNAFLVAASAFTLTAGTVHFFPRLASDPLDEHMKEMGLPPISDHYLSTDIRVLKNNPLSTFALAEQVADVSFHELKEQQKIENFFSGKDFELTLGQKIKAPLLYARKYIKSYVEATLFLREFDAQPAGNAFAFPGSGDVHTRTSYILPPKETDLGDYLHTFSGISAGTPQSVHNVDSLSKIFYAAIMCHEAVHCDQDKNMPPYLKESEADLVGFQNLREAFKTQSKAVSEIKEALKHSRVINAVCASDIPHYSTPSLEKNYLVKINTLGETEQMFLFSQVLDLTMSKNVLFSAPLFTDPPVISYYVTKELLHEGFFDREYAGLKQSALKFMEAVEYFDRISGNSALSKNGAEEKIRAAVKQELLPLRPENAQPPCFYNSFDGPYNTLKPSI